MVINLHQGSEEVTFKTDLEAMKRYECETLPPPQQLSFKDHIFFPLYFPPYSPGYLFKFFMFLK